MKPSSTLNDEVRELDIAEGLKLLINTGFTIDLILDLGYRGISEELHLDPYVGKLIVNAALKIIQERQSGLDIL